MKTPRELLFRKHQPIEPALDDLREKFIAGLPSQNNRSTLANQYVADEHYAFDWFRLLLVPRWQFAALAAAWVLIATLRLGAGMEPNPHPNQPQLRATHPLILTLKENRRQLVEFSGGSTAPVAPLLAPPHSRRSCLQPDWSFA